MSAPRLFDRRLLRARRQRTGSDRSFLLDRIAPDLGERLAAVNRRFELALDLGTPGDQLRQALTGSERVDRIVVCEPLAATRRSGPLRVAGDEEALPFADGAFNLVVSALALQFVNDLPGTLIQIRRALKPDGLLLAAILGGDTLTELRQSLAAAESEIEGGAAPRVIPFVEVRALGSLLQRAAFALPVTDVDRFTVRYGELSALFRDLRAMGATNPLIERSRSPLRRSTLARASEIYAERFADPDGRLRATFDVVWLSGWAPHESQQQPLRPGSARRRLADALGTTEHAAGEKADPRRR